MSLTSKVNFIMHKACLTLSGATDAGYAIFDCENNDAVSDLVLEGFKRIGNSAVINEGDLFVSVMFNNGKAIITHGNNKTNKASALYADFFSMEVA